MNLFNPFLSVKNIFKFKSSSRGTFIPFNFFTYNSSFTNSTFCFIVFKIDKFFFNIISMVDKKNIILAFGNKEFNNSLNEIQEYLSFNLITLDNL